MHRSSEASLAAISMARQAGYASVVSHRPGDSGDTTIADLSVVA
ncbi:hypothetical protein [Paraburkholderia sp. HD33-4]